tara:strand:+ start:143 stop:370 length:228 start_codon:yes stop_codon:yes gene_type:complete
MCPSRPSFFGLNNKYIASVYEEFFLLKYHGGWSFTEAYNLPIKIRRWFLERLVKQKEDENKAMEKAMKSNDTGRS